jgi:predicted RNase H-like HicB family nuclease
MPQVKVEVTFETGIRWDEAMQTHLAYTPSLGIYAQADTEEAAVNATGKAIDLYFEVLTKEHKGLAQLIDVLRELEIPIYGDGEKIPESRKHYARMLLDGGFKRVVDSSVSIAG